MAFLTPAPPSSVSHSTRPLSWATRWRPTAPLAAPGAGPSPLPCRLPVRTSPTCGRRNGRSSSSSSSRGRPPPTPRFGEEPPAGGQRRRPVRVGELLKRELSGVIPSLFSRDYVREEGAGSASSVLISIMDVRVSDDLRSARVKVSVLGDAGVRATAMSWLKSARRTIRHEVARELRGMKTIPELVFDESFVADSFATVSVIERLAAERREREAEGGKSAAAPSRIKSTFSLADVDGLTDEEVQRLEQLDGLDGLDDGDDDVIIQ